MRAPEMLDGVDDAGDGIDRRELLARGGGLALAVGVLPVVGAPSARARTTALHRRARAIVGDVVRFGLETDAWAGSFGLVVLRLHRGVFDGHEVHFIRTDASQQAYARRQRLVYAPKLQSLAADGLSGAMHIVDNGPRDQAPVLSSEPGRPDYTPAWRLHRVTWTAPPRLLRSVAEVQSARSAGELTVRPTAVVLNAAVVKWSSGELAVDPKLTAYHVGQLIERPNTTNGTVMFKLHQCYPGSRYIVTDHSLAGPAEATKTIFAPRLQGGPTRAGATGRVNPFLNGLRGDGPFGFQPSVFDSRPGTPAWSPYWDHWAYRWRRPSEATVLRTLRALHAARDRGRLREFRGVPDTRGTLFTVNCQVPVVAPVTYRPPRRARD